MTRIEALSSKVSPIISYSKQSLQLLLLSPTSIEKTRNDQQLDRLALPFWTLHVLFSIGHVMQLEFAKDLNLISVGLFAFVVFTTPFLLVVLFLTFSQGTTSKNLQRIALLLLPMIWMFWLAAAVIQIVAYLSLIPYAALSYAFYRASRLGSRTTLVTLGVAMILEFLLILLMATLTHLESVPTWVI